MSWLTQPPIVVPFDFSPSSVEAVDKAIELLGSSDGVHVIHVLGELSPADPGEVWNSVDETTRTHHATQAIRKELTGEKYQNLQVVIAFGNPGHQITDYANKIEASAILVPSHGRSSIMRVLVGSVAERVVRLAKCPVIVIKTGKLS